MTVSELMEVLGEADNYLVVAMRRGDVLVTTKPFMDPAGVCKLLENLLDLLHEDPTETIH